MKRILLLFLFILVLPSLVSAQTNIAIKTLSKENSCYYDKITRKDFCYSTYQFCLKSIAITSNSINFKYKTVNGDIFNDLNKSGYISNLKISITPINISCVSVNISAYKNPLISLDNIPCYNIECDYKFQWWNSSFDYRFKHISNVTSNPTHVLNLNDTYNPNIWISNHTETIYLYCQNAECSGIIAVGNETDEINWENSSTHTGNNPKLVAEEQLQAWTHFDESATASYEDSSRYSRKITPISQTWNPGGVIQHSVNSTTTGSYINISINDPPINDVDRAICFWYYPNTCAADYVLFSQGIYASKKWWAIDVTSTTCGIEVDAYGNNIGPSIKMALKAWNFVCVSYVSATSTLTFMINDTIETETAPINYETTATNISIGGMNMLTGNTYSVNGTFDEVMIFNRSLSVWEMQEFYYNGMDNLSRFNINYESYSDISAPILNFVYPTDSENTVNYTWSFVNISGNENLRECILDFNGTNSTMLNDTDSNFYYNETPLSNGNYSIFVFCNDSANNTGYNSTWVYINYTIPIIIIPEIISNFTYNCEICTELPVFKQYCYGSYLITERYRNVTANNETTTISQIDSAYCKNGCSDSTIMNFGNPGCVESNFIIMIFIILAILLFLSLIVKLKKARI